MPRKTKTQRLLQGLTATRIAASDALQRASKSMGRVVDLYIQMLDSGSVYERIQAAQGLERLSLRWEVAQGEQGGGMVQIQFSGSVPKLGEPKEDAEASPGGS